MWKSIKKCDRESVHRWIDTYIDETSFIIWTMLYARAMRQIINSANAVNNTHADSRDLFRECWRTTSDGSMLGPGGAGPQILPRPTPQFLDTVVLLVVDVIGSIVISLSRCCLPNDKGPGPPPKYFFLEPPLHTTDVIWWLLLSESRCLSAMMMSLWQTDRQTVTVVMLVVKSGVGQVDELSMTYMRTRSSLATATNGRRECQHRPLVIRSSTLNITYQHTNTHTHTILLVRLSLSTECKHYWCRPVAYPISRSICVSKKCTVAKWLIWSGCHLGWWLVSGVGQGMGVLDGGGYCQWEIKGQFLGWIWGMPL